MAVKSISFPVVDYRQVIDIFVWSPPTSASAFPYTCRTTWTGLSLLNVATYVLDCFRITLLFFQVNCFGCRSPQVWSCLNSLISDTSELHLGVKLGYIHTQFSCFVARCILTYYRTNYCRRHVLKVNWSGPRGMEAENDKTIRTRPTKESNYKLKVNLFWTM